MAPYSEIFAVCMALNVLVTFLSSSKCQKFIYMLPCFGSYRTYQEDRTDQEDETEPLKKDNESSSEAQEDRIEEQSQTGPLTENKESSSVVKAKQESAHSKLLTGYLCVYLLATASDWFQGPYVYALYSAYDFTQHDIAVLFVAGFGSSMIFGSFIGGMADSGGRRKYVVIYCVVYAASCLTKHFKDYWILMIGRLLGGVATSLLFSVFDAWLIKAHAEAKLDRSFMSKSFSSAAYGNSIVAILTGLVANYLANFSEMSSVKGYSIFHVGGYLAPFDAALFVLIVCGLLAQTTWKENYGDIQEAQSNTSSPNFFVTLQNALRTCLRNTDILICGLVSSLFEGSMYIFVFMWTPMLSNLSGQDANIPFGLIFATFMVSCMVGSSLFSIIVGRMRVEKICIGIFLVAAIAMGAIRVASSDTACFIAMNIFEICVGMYFPSMGTMKSSIVPENQRSAIYNLYRVPLNFIVVTILLKKITPQHSFLLTAVMLAVACVLQIKLHYSRLVSSPSINTKKKNISV